MKRKETKLDEILRLPPGAQDEMGRALDRIKGRLRSDTGTDQASMPLEEIPQAVSKGWRMPTALLAAAAILLVVLGGVGVVWNSRIYGVLANPDGESHWIYKETAFGGAGGLLTLRDGSRVEIRAMSDALLQRADDGVRIQLNKGAVIVNAAKQRKGHLYVRTKDLTVSVVGTVFFVSAEDAGSRVTVFEGKVQVQQGATGKQLRPGEQVDTSLDMKSLRVREEISWSGDAEQHLALLDNARTSSITAAPGSRDPEWQTAAGGRMSFESASVRSSDSREPGAFPLTIDGVFRSTGGVFKASFPLRYYVEFAYKLSLTPEQREALFSRVPKWVETDHFVINAKAPISNPTKDQMRLMMQSLLAERFKLALHVQQKQSSALALTLVQPGKLGPQFRPHAEGPPCPTKRSEADLFPADIDSGVWPYSCDFVVAIRPGGISLARLGPEVKKTSEQSQLIAGRNVSIEVLLDGFVRLGGAPSRPLVDQTGLSGSFDFSLEWMPESDSAFFDAVKEQLGMKLEAARVPVPALIVDHVERPSEN